MSKRVIYLALILATAHCGGNPFRGEPDVVKQDSDSNPNVVTACAKGSKVKLTEILPCPGNREPEYPFEANVKRQEGAVELKGYLSGDGSVEQVSVETSSRSTDLDKAAIKAFSKWRYAPGPTGWITKIFTFHLSKK